MTTRDPQSAPQSRRRIRRACPERSRRDGWTPERQLGFLDALARTRSVTQAARSAGMSRKAAYRLRDRRDGALFAALWDRILQPDPCSRPEGHIAAWSDGRLARLLGTHFRRQSGDFASIGSRSGPAARR